VPVLREPLPLADRRLLRVAVLNLAQGERRRRVPASLNVGVPGAAVTTVPDDQTLDHGVRTEIVGALLRARRDPRWVWVTRSGPLTVQDADAAWLGPTVAAAAERGIDVSYVVVTRHGWLDPRSGLRRQWKRIRQR
jgi:uncharacterized protein YdeI (BOF family)